MRNFLSVVTRSRLALLGTVIATVALLLFLILFGMELAGHEGGPYLGILVYLLLPGLVVLGLLLIPIGVWRAQQARTPAAKTSRRCRSSISTRRPRAGRWPPSA